MRVPIFVAHFQKRKLCFYGNAKKNKGGREAPCKQAHGHGYPCVLQGGSHTMAVFP